MTFIQNLSLIIYPYYLFGLDILRPDNSVIDLGLNSIVHLIQVIILKWYVVKIEFFSFVKSFIKILNLICQLKFCFVHSFDLYLNMGLFLRIATLLMTFDNSKKSKACFFSIY